jgi:ABC-type glycerol-3-phosphate transport system substrate-binding protein
MLMDMMPYLDADPELKQNLVSSVLEAQKHNGHLYSVSPFFGIYTLTGKSSVWGDKTELTTDDLKNFMGKTAPSLFTAEITRRNFLSDCLYMRASSFIDREAVRCSFDSPEFIALLEYAKSLPENYPADFSDAYEEERLQSGDALLSTRAIFGFNQIVGLEKVIFGEPVTFLSYPAGKTDRGASGEPVVTATLSNEISIMKNAANPDGAWAFTKFLLTDPAALPKENEIFALYKPTLKKRAEDAKVKDPDRETTYGVNMTPIPPNTDADNAKIFALIDRVNNVSRLEPDLVTIISDDINAFFAGDKTAEDTAAMIQNRVTTYIQESQ